MKKIVLLLVIVMMNLMMLKAQIITVNPSSFQLDFLSSDYSGEANAMVHNSSTVSRTLRWVRIVESQPSGWTSSICDKNNCYSATTSTKEFSLGADSSGLLKLSIVPNGVEGEGHYQVLVYDVNDSANANTVMIVDAVAQVTGISNVSDPAVSIYPNPVKDMLHVDINATKHITSIDIHNLVGQKIKTVTVQEGIKTVNVSVGDLKKGIYFVRVFNEGKEISTMTFSKD